MRNFAAAAAVIVFLAVGCGGGGSGGGPGSLAPETGSFTTALGNGTVLVQTQAVGDLRTLEIYPEVPIFGIYGTRLTRVGFQMVPGRLLFCRSVGGVTQVFTGEPDGSRSKRLTYATVASTRPRYSPDATKIAFARDGKLWVVNGNGTHERMIMLFDLTKVGHPAWLNEQDIIVKAEKSGQQDLFRVGLGGGVTQITNDGARELDPDVSPDRSWIVFSRSGCCWELYLVRSSGGTVRPLVVMTGDSVKPRWAPDGSAIVFAHKTSGNWEIWKVNPDGSGATRLTNNPAVDTYPVWSPDATRIRWIRSGDELWEMNADGTNQHRVRTGISGSLDWWGPATDVNRTFIGPTGSDFGGANPPFGSSRLFIIIVGGEGGTSAVSGSVGCGASGSNVSLRIPQSDMYVHTPVVELRAPCVNAIYEDNGPGIPATTYDMPTTGGNKPSAVLMAFNDESGRLFAVLPIGVEVTSATAAPPYSMDRNGTQVILQGTFAGVFATQNGPENLAPAGAYRVVLDTEQGRVVSIQ